MGLASAIIPSAVVTIDSIGLSQDDERLVDPIGRTDFVGVDRRSGPSASDLGRRGLVPAFGSL